MDTADSGSDSGSFDESDSTKDLGHGKSSSDPTSGGSSSGEPIFIDNFKIETQLGRGGMGEVYLATEQGLNRQVALKVLPAANRISSTQVKRFLLEAQAAAQLSHDHIVPIYHVGKSQGVHYFTMRFIEGDDLSKIIRNGQRALHEASNLSVDTQVDPQFKKSDSKPSKTDSTVREQSDSTGGRIDLSVDSLVGSKRAMGSRSAHKLAVSVALIGQAVAEALEHAHQHGIIHRDIKPSNLMLDYTNKIWVTDFGLAQLQNAEELTHEGDIVGTLRYMSPEQATGRRAFIDRRTDIYSLGVTLYELATLEKAARGDSAQEILRSITFERLQPIRKLNPKLPRDLETIICKATERNPSDRYQSAAEMAADLARFANSQSLVARRPSRLKAVRNWIWDRPAVSAMALAMLVVFAGSMLAVAMSNQQKLNAETKLTTSALKSLTISQGRLLQTISALFKDSNPGLAIVAGIEGAETVPGAAANKALMSAIDVSHELHTIPIALRTTGQCVVSAAGSKVLVCENLETGAVSVQRAPILDVQSGKQLGVLSNTTAVHSGAFVNADKYLVTFAPSVASTNTQRDVNSATGNIQIWNSQSFELVKSIACGGAVRISSRNYSTHTQQLVLPNSTDSVAVYDFPSLVQAFVLPTEQNNQVIECIYSPDGTKIGTLSRDGLACVFDAKTGRELIRFKNTIGSATTSRIFFTADSARLCIVGDGGSEIFSLDSNHNTVKRPERVVDVGQRQNVVVLLDPSHRAVIALNPQFNGIISEYKSPDSIGQAILVGDDKYIALVCDERITIIDVASGAKLAELCGHEDFISGVAAVRDRDELISVANDATVRHWNIRSDLSRRTLQTRVTPFAPVVLAQSFKEQVALLGSVKIVNSSIGSVKDANAQLRSQIEGGVVLVCSDAKVVTLLNERLTLWDMTTQRRTNVVDIPNFNGLTLSCVIELAASNQIALLTNTGELYFWEISTNRLVRYVTNPGDRIKAMVRRGASELILGLGTSELVSLDLVGWNKQSLAQLPCNIVDFELHPTKPWLLVTNGKNSATLWNLDEGKVVTQFGKEGVKLSQAFFGRDQVITHGGLSATSVNIWDAVSGEEIDSLRVNSVFRSEFNVDRTAIAVATKEGAVYWDLLKNERITIESGCCNSVGFVGDKLLVSVGSTQPINPAEKVVADRSRLLAWDVAEKKTVYSQPVNQHLSRIVAVPTTDQFVVSGFSYGAEIIDLNSARSKNRLEGHLAPILLADFGESPNRCVTVSTDGKILAHDLDVQQSVTIGVNDYPLTAAAISGDHRVLLIADQFNGVRQWDVSTRQLVREIAMDKQTPTRLVICSENNCAIAVLDDVVKHWDLRGKQVTDHPVSNGVRSVAISPDGKLVAVVPGGDPLHLANSQEAAVDLVKQSEVLVFRLDSKETSSIKIEDVGVTCQFIEGGSKLAVLMTNGKVDLFDTQSSKFLGRIQGRRRFVQLLQGPAGSPVLITTSKNQICRWNSNGGILESELNISLSEFEATVSVPIETFASPNMANHLIFTPQRSFVQPNDVRSYAKKIAPRLLSQEERSRLLEINAQ